MNIFDIQRLGPLRRLLFVSAAQKEQYTEETATGNPATFTTDVAKSLTGLTIHISDENGVSGLNVYRTGFNVWDEAWELGTINSSGGNSSSELNIRSKDFVPVVPGAKYYIKYTIPNQSVSSNMKAFFYDADKTYIANSAVWLNPGERTIPSGAHYVRFYMDTKYGTEYLDNISFNYPSTETTYHAYEGESYNVDFGESVTAGSFDAVSGILAVTSPESKTVQLSPLSIGTVVGNNNVFTDKGGSNTVKYLKKPTDG